MYGHALAARLRHLIVSFAPDRLHRKTGAYKFRRPSAADVPVDGKDENRFACGINGFRLALIFIAAGECCNGEGEKVFVWRSEWLGRIKTFILQHIYFIKLFFKIPDSRPFFIQITGK